MNDETVSLSTEAKAALVAYEHMSDSKQAYFSVLQRLDEKYKNGGKASKEEEAELGALLLKHDQRVTEFNQAMEKVTGEDDRMALIKCMQ